MAGKMRTILFMIARDQTTLSREIYYFIMKSVDTCVLRNSNEYYENEYVCKLRLVQKEVKAQIHTHILNNRNAT